MVVEQVWDTTMTDSMSEELAYFSGLKFAVPTATSQICALPIAAHVRLAPESK